jgi:glyoxalase family protein
MQAIRGIHHVTAIAGDPQRNLDFYVRFLGLRFVKRTVNFDDPHTYHFYFGDEAGSPGSIMTFFPWPGARRGRQGTGQIAVTSFTILPSAIGFWVERLLRHNVAFEGPTKRWDANGRTELTLAFKDHDGLMLQLVGHQAAEGRPAWEHAAGIGADQAIHGIHTVELWEERGEATGKLLVDTLGFRELDEEGGTRRYAVGDAGPGAVVDVRTVGGFMRATGGVGTVHHVAWCVDDDDAELALRQHVIEAGVEPTPMIDRTYFHSVYFREPGGVLFELATRAPGFTLDESLDTLGEALKLPPQYEPRRTEIEAVLPPIHLPEPVTGALLLADAPTPMNTESLGFIHRFVAPSPGAARPTLLLLHGTGGDEDNLIALGRELLPGAALLSPRGKVLENGALRFFRRIAEGVFDQEDLALRTDELAGFITGAVKAYDLDPGGIVAVGFSNGANIATSVLLRRPGLLRGAVLLSPMVPFEPDPLPALAGTSVFIGAGRNDPMVPVALAERLVELLRQSGAEVAVHWEPGGHVLTATEVEAVRGWLKDRFGPSAARQAAADVQADGFAGQPGAE